VSTRKVIRMLTAVDDCTRECPAIEVDTSLGGLRVRRVLDRVAAERGLPEAIVLDNGPEFCGRAFGRVESRTGGATGVHSAGQTGAECLCGKLQRPATRRVLERELVHEFERCTEKNRNLAARLQPAAPAQCAGQLAAAEFPRKKEKTRSRRVGQHTSAVAQNERAPDRIQTG
jgi:transposase InsO family protein